MTTNKSTQKGRHFRLPLREIWNDSVAAHRAMRSLTPYYDRHRDDGR